MTQSLTGFVEQRDGNWVGEAHTRPVSPDFRPIRPKSLSQDSTAGSELGGVLGYTKDAIPNPDVRVHAAFPDVIFGDASSLVSSHMAYYLSVIGHMTESA